MDPALRFAYDSFRPGQKELAIRVYEACLSGETLIAEAMSGFGKTAAVLTGAISAAEESGCRVVYACRTKRQIQRVADEAAASQSRHPLSAASMTTKFDYCLLKKQRAIPQESFAWYCGFNVSNNLCSYFLNVALLGQEFENLVGETLHRIPTHAVLLQKSESLHVCPYEVTRLAITQARLLTVPYQYVFDPRSSSVLFDRGSLGRSRTILVVDEAHNLRDFLRGVNSTTLTLDEIEWAVTEATSLMMEEAAASLEGLKAVFENAMKQTPGWLLDKAAILERFHAERGTPWLQNLAFELTACAGAAWGAIALEKRLPSRVLKVGEFVASLSSSSRAVLAKWDRTLGLIDPNPVADLDRELREFRSAVLVSATINPSDVFIRSLGLSAEVTASYHVLEEPAVTVKTIIDTGVSTRYRSRSPEMFAKIAKKVAAIIEATENGVGVFAPSYSVLDPISEMVSKRVGERPLLSERRGMSSQDAADIFESFRSQKGAVLFAVQGGRFSEGEDFKENLMDVAVVVGLSLPPPSPLLYAEYSCLKRAGEQDSYLMLSRLPALRKAFQAAGRHVRNPGKRGMVLFLDDRFASAVVESLMPTWLKRDMVKGNHTPEGLFILVRSFWGGKG